MKPAVVTPDLERLVVDVLGALLGAQGETCTVGIGVPEGWAPDSSDPHVQVESAGIDNRWPVIARGSIRLIARAPSTTDAKRLAALAEGLLLGYNDSFACRPLAGVLPARDPDTRAELASVTVAVTARTTPIN